MRHAKQKKENNEIYNKDKNNTKMDDHLKKRK